MFFNMFLWVGFVVLIIIIVGSFITIYNGLIHLKKSIKKAWKNIDVLLKQRNDELPKIIDACKVYMGYEERVIKEVTANRLEAQKAISPKEEALANEHIKKTLLRLFAVAENYPKLKASKNFQKLQERISKLENKISDRREFYNSVVNTYNIRINQIPHSIVADFLKYEEMELFNVPEEEKADIDIMKSFNK